VISRRVLLGTGVVVVGAGGLITAAQLTHRLDDIADAVGLDPKPLPDPDDTRILRRAAADTARLLATVEATAALHASVDLTAVVSIIHEQLAAVGGATAPPADAPPADAPPADAEAALRALEDILGASAADRSIDAQRAGSPALVRVLASMSAGHAQSARLARRLR